MRINIIHRMLDWICPGLWRQRNKLKRTFDQCRKNWKLWREGTHMSTYKKNTDPKVSPSNRARSTWMRLLCILSKYRKPEVQDLWSYPQALKQLWRSGRTSLLPDSCWQWATHFQRLSIVWIWGCPTLMPLRWFIWVPLFKRWEGCAGTQRSHPLFQKLFLEKGFTISLKSHSRTGHHFIRHFWKWASIG